MILQAEPKNTLLPLSENLPASESICFSDGWYAQMIMEWILGFGKK
jgi:hypothetical protein